MANGDEEVIIDNRIEVLADALTNPDVDIENVETHSDLEALMKRAVIAIRNAQASSSAGSVWGQITGNLADQTDLTRTLSDKASVSDLAAIDTRTRTLENTMPTKANQTDVDAALDAKANTVDVNAALDLKADTSYVTQMLATKADQNALDAKANISDVESMFSQLIPVINGKEDTTSVNSKLDLKANKPRVFSATVNKDDWSTSYPYTYNVSLPTVTSSENYEIYLILASNLTEEQVTKQQNSFSYIWYGETSENKVTLYARKKPEVTLNISLRQVV